MHVSENHGAAQKNNAKKIFKKQKKNNADLHVLTWKDVREKLLKGKKQVEEQSRQ